jgi:hypothetical protein
MGHFIRNKSKISLSKARKLNVTCAVVVGHRAIVLTSADVEANRSKAYTYLPL